MISPLNRFAMSTASCKSQLGLIVRKRGKTQTFDFPVPVAPTTVMSGCMIAACERVNSERKMRISARSGSIHDNSNSETIPRLLCN
jgi:hypothetical protein